VVAAADKGNRKVFLGEKHGSEDIMEAQIGYSVLFFKRTSPLVEKAILRGSWATYLLNEGQSNLLLLPSIRPSGIESVAIGENDVAIKFVGLGGAAFPTHVKLAPPANKKIIVERAIEGGIEVMEAKLPAVVSVIKGINEPRLPNLMGIRKAAKADISQWNADDLGVDKGKVGAAGASTKVVEIAVPPPRGAGEILKGELEMVGCVSERVERACCLDMAWPNSLKSAF
jgi:electron transfer flavoprotein beta subunit